MSEDNQNLKESLISYSNREQAAGFKNKTQVKWHCRDYSFCHACECWILGRDWGIWKTVS